MQFLKSNSCLLAFDNSPSFSTGEKLGLFFADFIQNVDLRISPPRTQSRQIGGQEFGVDSVNFSPDVEVNLSYLSRSDFNIDLLLGSLFRPSGVYISPFSGVRDFSFNSYLFFSDQQSNDLLHQIKSSNSFSGVNVISLGNCFLTNQNLSFRANQLSQTACSFISSNIKSETLSGNYMQVPAVNLESGNFSGAAQIFLDPGQVSRIETGNSSGLFKTWLATFQPSFDDLQIPNQKLSSAVINGLEISTSIERENSYGFGSDYVFGRDIKYPIQTSVSINGIVNSYDSGNYSSIMTNESRYNIEIFNRDPQDLYLSGLSNQEVSGLVKTDHLTKNRWLKFDNCILREKNDSLAINGLLEFSNQFGVSVTENGGMTFKQGEVDSLDDVYLHSSDFHKCISRDGFSPVHNPFVQYYEEDCSIANLLSSDRKILLTRDNFVEGDQVQSCALPFTGPLDALIAEGAVLRHASSVRRLLSSYLGPACRLRGNGAGTQEDIVYLEDGSLDLTAAAELALADGGTKAFWHTAYDQAEISNATQITSNSQPLFGTDDEVKGSMQGDASTKHLDVNLGTLSTPSFVSFVVNAVSTTESRIFFGSSSTTPFIRKVGENIEASFGTQLLGGPVSIGKHTVGVLVNSSSSAIYVDGSLVASGDVGNTALDMTNGRIGRGASSTTTWFNTFGNTISEVIVFDGDPTSLSGWTDFITAQKSYFGI